MKQYCLVNDLLEWIERNLTNRLSIDNVAIRSGYSKSHLQRMFKKITGHMMGSYIRDRQLSQSAIELKLTNRSIVDISDRYNFDSQQSYTRAFKKQFGESPARYRKDEDWDTKGIAPPLDLEVNFLPLPTYVINEESILYMLTCKYEGTIDSFPRSLLATRNLLWGEMVCQEITLPNEIYGVHMVTANPENEDEQIIFYGAGISEKDINSDHGRFQKIIVDKGLYAKFEYHGLNKELHDFILKLYNTVLPSLGLIRRKGFDVEKYHVEDIVKNNDLSGIISCEYMIPVKIKPNEECAE